MRDEKSFQGVDVFFIDSSSERIINRFFLVVMLSYTSQAKVNSVQSIRDIVDNSNLLPPHHSRF